MPGLRASERLSALCPIDFETFPFRGQPVIRVWLVVHDDTSMHLQLSYPRVPVYGYSRFPERFCHPVWQLRSLLPAFDPRLPGARRGEGLSPVHQGIQPRKRDSTFGFFLSNPPPAGNVCR